METRIHCIDQLPDDCLLKIFSALPTTDLLLTNRVCRKWYSLQPIACRARKNLTLVMYDEYSQRSPKYHYKADLFVSRTCAFWQKADMAHESATTLATRDKWSSVKVSTFYANDAIEPLAEKFRNMSDLQLCFFGPTTSFTKAIELLLGQLRLRLEALRIWQYQYPEVNAQLAVDYKKIFAAFMTMPKLRTLVIDVDMFLFDQYRNQAIDLPILSQLDHFFLYTLDPINTVLDSVVKYAANNPNLQSFRVRNSFTSAEAVKHFFRMSHSFSKSFVKKFINLNIAPPTPLEASQVASLCRSFTSLTCLWIRIYFNDFYDLLVHVGKLPQLKFLWLYLTENETTSATDSPTEFVLIEIPPPLVRIQSLSLSIDSKSHDILSGINWDRFFPNILVLRIWEAGRQCKICKFEDCSQVPRCHLSDCTRQLLQPFKKCTAIRQIFYTGADEQRWTLAEL